ncbi:DNA-directed RNA polymerase III subunit RPC4 [Vanrija pseudolonga]|uniref:DNA-directed RNA polymerase III subunit RPC4 n=1 Tax=Vanrija pseudolonga TaxID=143232 RepID=A0AAF0Y8S3_9TREE|nr:DNA-directed RNA polymerase III subunit RPC4 [Vanrija pseudolonga]
MSGRDIKPRLPAHPGPRRSKPVLVAAAAAEADGTAGPSTSTAPPARSRARAPAADPDAMHVDSAPEASAPPAPRPVAVAAVAGPSTASRSATPTGPNSGANMPALSGGEPAASGVAKMKFKPKMPIRRTVQEPEVKAEPTPAPSTRGRGAPRGRGRGAGPGRGGRPQQVASQTIAAGPFGGTRPGASRRAVVAPPPPARHMGDVTSVEVYSDNEDGSRPGVIDIDAVSALSESAPTSLYRDRDLDGGKAKLKEEKMARLKEIKKARKAERRRRTETAASRARTDDDVDMGGVRVKAEPLSPSASHAALLDPNAGVPAPLVRVGDRMLPADVQQDRDADGRLVRNFVSGTTESTPETDVEFNKAQAVDLSESEEEEEEDDLDGDFVEKEGGDNPEDKLFLFQFPSQMPKLVRHGPIDATGDVAMVEEKPDVKPTAAALKARKKDAAAAPPPEGRIGTLVVMKSGKVKLVFGEGDAGIVMNVSAGVPTTFLQQLVHVDTKAKSANVLGEIHKQYTVTPDIDRLLEELFLNGGETPGDREKRELKRIKMEAGLVKMEPGSP